MCCTKHCSNGVPRLVQSDVSQQRRPAGGPAARRAINVRAEARCEEPTRTSVACQRHVARLRHESRVNACRSLGARSCCLLFATDLVNGPDHQSEAKFRSYSRRRAEVKQHKAGSRERQEYISLPFTLFIMPNSERETEKNKKKPTRFCL